LLEGLAMDEADAQNAFMTQAACLLIWRWQWEMGLQADSDAMSMSGLQRQMLALWVHPGGRC
jgi:hypothetical protein